MEESDVAGCGKCRNHIGGQPKARCPREGDREAGALERGNLLPDDVHGMCCTPTVTLIVPLVPPWRIAEKPVSSVRSTSSIESPGWARCPTVAVGVVPSSVKRIAASSTVM